MNNMEEIGVHIRHARKRLGLTLDIASAEAGVSITSAAKVERGYIVKHETLSKYADFFGFDIRVQLIER